MRPLSEREKYMDDRQNLKKETAETKKTRDYWIYNPDNKRLSREKIPVIICIIISSYKISLPNIRSQDIAFKGKIVCPCDGCCGCWSS